MNKTRYSIQFLVLGLLGCTYSASAISGFVCPNTDCQQECVSQTSCPNGQILIANTNICGCCLECIGGEGLGVDCRSGDDISCAPGLTCSRTTGKCELDKGSCFYTKHLSPIVTKLPTCDVDGSFEPVQCKGDPNSGRCFCYSESGDRIFGWDWWRNIRDSEMNCACSRKRYNMERNGRTDVTIHCKQNGNFEELQCDLGLCWCADELTGLLQDNTVGVPKDLWKALPCYNSTLYGDQYFRQCDSIANAQTVLRSTFAKRNTTNINLVSAQCSYDGTYGLFTLTSDRAVCMWRDGTTIGNNGNDPSLARTLDCFCARDLKIFEDVDYPLTCAGTGSYNTIQHMDGDIYCVDRDGYAVSSIMENETVETINCAQYLYYS